ncbi:hypothetical protein G6F38_011255 [Rhizopus arrhizus]|nr:hypothetical protein G6F38_011255 [Rhizopus arrhizus]
MQYTTNKQWFLFSSLNKLRNEEIKEHDIEEQELIVNYADPIFSPLLHDPGHGKLFIWLNRNVLQNYEERPDAGCVALEGRRLDGYFGFVEAKADYKKKDTVKTHEVFLRLSLFGMNALEEHNSKCILLMQVIGSGVYVYECFNRVEGAVVIVELKVFKLPMSLKDFPGFIMSLDELKKVDHFYHLRCFGIIKISLRKPIPFSKKRKLAGDKKQQTKGTVTNHYVNFIKDILAEMDTFPEMKGHYLIMDNAPIHTSKIIGEMIEERGYKCICLPPYSSELNPIERFWAVVKSSVKREFILRKDTIPEIIADASNQVPQPPFEGFARYSVKRFDDCLASHPI